MTDKNNDDNDPNPRKLTEAEAAIIEFMKNKASLDAASSTGEEDNKEHTFWNTQVSRVV